MSGGCLAALQWRMRYATNRNDLSREFYGPALRNSTCYDRAVGFFRSSAFLVVTRELADFALRSGRIRLVASPELAEADIESLQRGYDLRDIVTDAILRVIEEALVDPDMSAHAEFLATLVARGTIDLKLALRPGAIGIFHDKVGLFRDDDGHSLSFTGSINESLTAWDQKGNHESFDVFRSWAGGDAAMRVQEHSEYFESLWAGLEPGLEIMAFPDAARAKLLKIANSDGIEAAYERAAAKREPARDDRLVPFPHQLAALADWERNGRRGILTHATASGKTLTAIEAMRIWLQSSKPVLVVVPSDLLFRQWRSEIARQLGEMASSILLCGSGHSKWSDGDVLATFTGPRGGARIVLATIQTASTKEFIRRVRGGDHLMVVCDEVHHAGAAEYSRILNIAAGPRLGLSASPERFGDPEGTAAIRSYFGPDLEPRFGIPEGIRAKRLVPYTYQVHFVQLRDDEMAAWQKLTHEIRKQTAIAIDDRKDADRSDRLKMLLIRRARLLKQAAAKVPFATEFLLDNVRDGDRWLVYCDDQRQMHALRDALSAAHLQSAEYHSAMTGDRDATLDHFIDTGGILLAIKCLDEGVDIPSVDHALILASSRNPREFIQRRGRLLRVASGKQQAEIHDLLVTPPTDSDSDDLAILKGEVLRAVEFASSASNDGVKFRLRTLIRESGFADSALLAGFEVDAEAEDPVDESP